MRTFSNAALEMFSTKQGIEPVMIVKVFWTTNSIEYYADKINSGIQGKIQSVSGIDDCITLDGNSGSASVSITLDDYSGDIKTIINNIDPHRRPVQILQHFVGLPLSDAFIIFEGLINSPMVWKEGDRTFTFDVVTKLEDNEAGFSVEEGLFEYIPPEIIGKAWPLVFGRVNGVPTIQLNSVPSGITAEESGLNSTKSRAEELANRNKSLEDLRNRAAEAYALGARYQLLAANVAGTDFLNGTESPDEIQSLKDTSQGYYDQYTDYSNEYLDMLRNFALADANLLRRSNTLLKTQIRMINGRAFPRNTPIVIRIQGVQHVGTMIGDTFIVQSAIDPYSGQNANFVKGPANIDNRNVITEYRTQVALNRFFYMASGSVIAIDGNYPLTYIVGLTTLNVVSVIGTYKDFKVVVPRNYYSVQHRQYGSLIATFIVFPKPLSVIDENWSDEISTNVISNLGPHIIDILVWLIQTYTNYTYDPGSFGFFREYLNSCPANFVLTEKVNVFQLINEIAFQARCTVWLKDGIFYIKYLPLERGPIAVITPSDIVQQTLEIFSGSTEELVTKITALWKADASQTDPNKIIFRYNILKYGSQEQEYNFFCFNNQQSVQKAIEFWLIRKSNTWKKIRFQTFLNKLMIEKWDTVRFELQDGMIANGNVDGIIESAVYDSESNTIIVEAWLPIRMGEMTPFPYALPSSIDISYIYPIPNDTAVGSPQNIGSTINDKLLDRAPLLGPGFQYSNMPSTFGQLNNGTFTAISDDAAVVPPLLSQLDSSELLPNTYDPISAPIDPEYVQYVVKDIKTLVPDTGIAAKTIPGIIREKIEGPYYKVEIYPYGLNGSSQIVKVGQLTIDETTELTPDVGVMVTKMYLEDRVEYTMQAPVWTAGIPIPEETVDEEGVPIVDPGIPDDSGEGDGTGEPDEES